MKTAHRLFLLLLICIVFVAGIFVGRANDLPLKAAQDARYEMAKELYTNVKSTYGGVRFDGPEHKNIVGTIALFKDINLAVYQDGNVKTIRVYEP